MTEFHQNVLGYHGDLAAVAQCEAADYASDRLSLLEFARCVMQLTLSANTAMLSAKTSASIIASATATSEQLLAMAAELVLSDVALIFAGAATPAASPFVPDIGFAVLS